MLRTMSGVRMSVVLGLLWSAMNGTSGGAELAPLAAKEPALAREILDSTGVRGGLVLHLGCGEGRLTAALRATESLVVQGLDADANKVARARSYVQRLGLYGPVAIDQLRGNRLPLVDDLVNLLVAEDPSGVPPDEMLRVLAPLGVASVKSGTQWTKTVKQRAQTLDEWTHYLYDASNNAVAHDAAVGPPRHVQWVCGPSWSRHHDHMASLSALVSANGRIFYILDEGPREAILLPARWMLIARDAFSGTLLWKRPIEEWNTHLWPLKSGPNQLPRRLVAVGDRVYVTLGIDAPVTALDAATGKTLLTYAGTEHADEILCADGTLYILAGREANKWKDYRPIHTYVWSNTQRANSQWAWDKVPRSIKAFDAVSGQTHWQQERTVAPLTLGADPTRILFYDGEKVVALNRQTGTELWTSEPVLRKTPFPTGYGPTLVVQQGVVLLSVENRLMTAFAAADGKKLWSAPHHPGGHASPDDMLVINGLVWSGAVASTGDSGVFTGRDLQTGEVKREFPPDVNPPWFHHRCYRSRATDKFFIAARTGIEYIDLEAQHWDFNHWVRGGCLYGFMPCNGLTYVPPQACGCFLESKLFGFNALRAAQPQREEPDAAERCEHGEAFGEAVASGPVSDDDWPTYRHDAQRSGRGQSNIPRELKRTWQLVLGGKLSSVVVAEGKVFVVAVDRHTVYAVDVRSGQPAWSYTVGGRVDSPPTISRGRVLFGSADGWVYCLRAADGRLAWRFRAAPQEQRVMAHDQLESAWPVSGSVLVANETVYCVAGRSAFLDGGLRLLRLEPQTGRLLSETRIDDRDPESGQHLQSLMKGQDLPVALPDILSCDGHTVYMRTQAFDLEGQRRHVGPLKLDNRARRRGEAPAEDEAAEIRPHLFARSGFLDDSWFFRSYWLFGTAIDSNYGGWLRPGHFAPSGRLMAFDDQRVYSFDRQPQYLCNASVQEYYLYAADREVTAAGLQRLQAWTNRINAASTDKGASSSDWATRKKFSLTENNAYQYHWAQGNPPIQARGLVLAGQTLAVAGPPDVVDEEAAFRAPDDPAIREKLAAQAAALQGRLGGQLLVVSATDGQTLAAYELGTVPTFDGLVAAQGCLYLTTLDGRLLCLGSTGTPLAPAAPPKLVALDTSIREIPEEPVPARGPSLAGEFSEVARAEVTRGELGYHVRSESKTPGLVLQKLPTPLTGKVQLKARMKVATDGQLKNGFVVFGESPDEATLVKCGLRYAMKKAVIVQGPLSGDKVAAQPFEPDESRVYDLAITVDVSSGAVTLQAAGTTVTATLDRPPSKIAWIGYAVLNAAAEFSPIDSAP